MSLCDLLALLDSNARAKPPAIRLNSRRVDIVWVMGKSCNTLDVKRSIEKPLRV